MTRATDDSGDDDHFLLSYCVCLSKTVTGLCRTIDSELRLWVGYETNNQGTAFLPSAGVLTEL